MQSFNLQYKHENETSSTPESGSHYDRGGISFLTSVGKGGDEEAVLNSPTGSSQHPKALFLLKKGWPEQDNCR